ncbi:hypothetical protein [Amycolatopsis sp. NBC_01286]|uniref:hypothetical protein n=1 Tax=Amycolatopsis sp. NBC_01286 TaxID=2903560 RepID=UPI002E1427FF|nr:hypothetical protein OG570_41230 [Amycolatopsis sp. NBC_01286]
MRVVFTRVPDGARASCVVERDDGVRYRVREGIGRPELPHDLVHLLVELQLRDDGGFWGAVADGAVFAGMDHLDGRRPPHARRRSDEAIGARKDRLQRAELMAGLVRQIAADPAAGEPRVIRAARDHLATLPDATVDVPAVLAAAARLRDAARAWAGTRPGDEVVVDWPRVSGRRAVRR